MLRMRLYRDESGLVVAVETDAEKTPGEIINRFQKEHLNKMLEWNYPYHFHQKRAYQSAPADT